MHAPVEGQRIGLRYTRMSVDDSAEQLRRQADDVDAICDLHDYVTKPEWLFTDQDESGNEETRFRQKKGERPGLAGLDAVVHDIAGAGHAVAIVAWVPSRLFATPGTRSSTFGGGRGLAMWSSTRSKVSGARAILATDSSAPSSLAPISTTRTT